MKFGLVQGDNRPAIVPEFVTMASDPTVATGHLLRLALAVPRAPNGPILVCGITSDLADATTGHISFAPCYVGDDTLWQSLWRTLCADNGQAVVQFGTPELALGRDRRAWAADLRETIAALRG